MTSHDSDTSRTEVFQGTLVGTAVGDGLGAPFEGQTGPIAAEQVYEATSVGWLRTTDDTAMTVDVAESLLQCGGLDEDHLAATFATSYARDPHRGYGAGAADLLRRIAAGEDWRSAAAQQFGGQGSLGNGAAMRAAPFGLHAAGSPRQAAELAGRGARITHTHPQGVEGAAALAAAVALLVTTSPAEPIDGSALVTTLRPLLTNDDLWAALETSVALSAEGTAAEIVATLGHGVAAIEAVPAAFAAFFRHPNSFADAVTFAISLGGDTDTIASMTGALSGARLGHSAIPHDWVERTEDAGRIKTLADRLATLPRQSSLP